MIRHYRSKGILDAELGLDIRRRVRLDGDFPVHTHEFSELVLILAGSATHVWGGRSYAIGPGDVFLTPARHSHGYRDANGLVRTIVMFDGLRYLTRDETLRGVPGFCSMFLLEPTFRHRDRFQSRLRLDRKNLDEACRLVEAMHDELAGRRPGASMMLIAQFHQLVISLSRVYSRGSTPASKHLLRIGQVLASLEAADTPRPCLTALARDAGMSVNHFLRLFRKATGYSPLDYWIRMRIQRGARLLADQGMSVTAAAFACGFDDSNYFSRQFRRIMGVSPGRFRQAAGRSSPMR
ncbi:MAG: helix-turn-helix domain-containing protein [Phycisphaeraceae bacterium]|nr:helix-turn-helix domain-containing protein [Phycisphaeraceae bacterium]